MAQVHNPSSGKAIMDPASYEALLRIAVALEKILENNAKGVAMFCRCVMVDTEATKKE